MGCFVHARAALGLGLLMVGSAGWTASADLEVFPLSYHERVARPSRSERLAPRPSSAPVREVVPVVATEPESTPVNADAATPNGAEPAGPQQEWDLRQDDGQIDVSLKRWATRMGYSFRWDAERYVLVEGANKFRGDFPSAIRQLLGSSSIKNSTFPLEACLYNNIPPLFRVTRMGDQSEDCK